MQLIRYHTVLHCKSRNCGNDDSQGMPDYALMELRLWDAVVWAAVWNDGDGGDIRIKHCLEDMLNMICGVHIVMYVHWFQAGFMLCSNRNVACQPYCTVLHIVRLSFEQFLNEPSRDVTDSWWSGRMRWLTWSLKLRGLSWLERCYFFGINHIMMLHIDQWW